MPLTISLRGGRECGISNFPAKIWLHIKLLRRRVGDSRSVGLQSVSTAAALVEENHVTTGGVLGTGLMAGDRLIHATCFARAA